MIWMKCQHEAGSHYISWVVGFNESIVWSFWICSTCVHYIHDKMEWKCRDRFILCKYLVRGKKWEQTEYWCVILIKYAIEWDMVLGWNLPLLLFCSWTTRLFITFSMIFVVNIIIGSFDRYTMNIGWFCSLCWVVHGTFHYPISTAKPPRHFQNGYRSAHAKKTLHPKQRGE